MGTLFLDASSILAAFDSDDEQHAAAKAILADPADAAIVCEPVDRFEQRGHLGCDIRDLVDKGLASSPVEVLDPESRRAAQSGDGEPEQQ